MPDLKHTKLKTLKSIEGPNECLFHLEDGASPLILNLVALVLLQGFCLMSCGWSRRRAGAEAQWGRKHGLRCH